MLHEETFYLLKSPANAKRIAAAIDEIEKMIAKKKPAPVILRLDCGIQDSLSC